MQLAPEASVAPHEFVTIWKGAVALKGVSEIVVELGGLEIVKAWVADSPPTSTAPKSWLAGEAVAAGGATALPESVMARGLPPASSQM